MKFKYRPVVETTKKERAYPYEPTESLREAAVRALHLVEAAAKRFDETGIQQVVLIEVLPIPDEVIHEDRRGTEFGGQLALFACEPDHGGAAGAEGLQDGVPRDRGGAERSNSL